MSKIFIIKILILIFLNSFSQENVIIKHLEGKVNTIGSELNFIQIDENTAYYTSSTLENQKYQSLIFKTNLINGKWIKGRYVDLGISSSFANIFPTNKLMYFSSCDNLDVCSIAVKNNSTQKTKLLNDKINLTNSSNTQPHLSNYNNTNILYFVSNRKGGVGGMDIWFSVVDNKGNYGEPINAGNKINTEYNEVTPFYNIWSKELFFSSDKPNKKSGFNIYKISGNGNLWDTLITASELNSNEDDLYVSFYNEFSGYFASNRSPALFEKNKNCCNDIFYFEYLKRDTLINSLNDTIKQKLPITLYFHNDEPDNNTLQDTTNKTYKECYVSYYLKKEKYLEINPNEAITNFFEHSLKKNYNSLNSTLNYILQSLKSGKKIELYVKGFASPLYDEEYNIYLSSRRINSLINMLVLFENRLLNPYIKSGTLKIIKLPYGESKSKESVNDNPKNIKKSIYSLDAMLERKIEVVDIIEL